jgi:dUTP pyrophosphatase
MLKIRFKKLNIKAVVPTKVHKDDAGFDLTAISQKEVQGYDKGYLEYGFGLAVEIPKGYVGIMLPRSSICRMGLYLVNGAGVIDSGYTGEIKAIFKRTLTGKQQYKVGDKVAQLIILPFPQVEWEEVEILKTSSRKDQGFGSTGT